MTSPAPLTPAETAAIEKAAAKAAGEGLTPAELAVATAMADRQNRAELAAGYGAAAMPGDFADDARAVVGAIEPHLTIAALERTVAALEEFAARKHRAGHRRDAVGIDEAAEFVLDELRKARQSLSLPASKETPNA